MTGTLENDLCVLVMTPYESSSIDVPNLKYVKLDDGRKHFGLDIDIHKSFDHAMDSTIQGVELFNAYNRHLFVAGWGVADENAEKIQTQALVARMKLVDTADCAKMISLPNSDVRKSVVCAVGENFLSDTCQGDSGGPLYSDINGQQVLLGIVSYGEGCGNHVKKSVLGFNKEIPGVYTRVAAYKDFIGQFVTYGQ